VKPISVKTALISVSDKDGIVDFARELQVRGVKILSTGGTASLLAKADIAVTQVADVTGFPEIMGGRVKTLHPKIHGAILGRRDIDLPVMEQHDIDPIDLVVVNLYPFRETIEKPDVSFDDAIENIDIGGPAMIRAAAKNHADVAVITDSNDYTEVLRQLTADQSIDAAFRQQLARKAFAHTAAYDSAIAEYLGRQEAEYTYPEELTLSYAKVQELRYGENPHQSAVFYRGSTIDGPSLANARQLHGKALSFNNIADSDAALSCVLQFDKPACVIVKHANPCGVAVADSLSAAYEGAYVCDPVSAFGGIIAFNQTLDKNTLAEILGRQFVEVILAPSVEEGVQALLSEKPNIRLLTYSDDSRSLDNGFDYKRVAGGLLVQQADAAVVARDDLQIVTKTGVESRQMDDLLFAWKVVKYVKSNAIVYCRDQATIGIGAGQMSRVYSARIAILKAQEAELEIAGSVMASDAFFPFRDSIDQAAQSGVSAIIQPGGSMRDDEVIAAADEHGIAMAFTSVRHFRH
jgi:phosphoribosylaminoimidazolecarboxamide formyltransferase/IMP cyclohydrolase